MKVTWISVAANVLIFGVKYYAGIQSNSIAMIADAWHSLSDSISSIIVFAGFWIASKPADYEHPFGHGRAESIASIIVATLLGVIGVNLIAESVSRIGQMESFNYSTEAIIIFGLTVAAKEILAQVSFRIGKKVKSESLVADGWHHRSDSISTVLVIAGALFGKNFWWIDGTMGILVSVILFYATYQIMRTSINSLLGETPSFEMKQKISAIAKEVNPAITTVHHFKIHSYGDHKEMNIDIRLPADMNVQDAHAIADAVEMTIYYRLGIRTTVHMEPGLHSDFLRRSNYY